MQTTKLFFRLTLGSCFSFFIAWAAIALFERYELQKTQIELLTVKENQLKKKEILFEKKKEWLSGQPNEHVVEELEKMELCHDFYNDLLQSEHHPFAKNEKEVHEWIESLENNKIYFSKNLSLVKPVYLETKDLEKMIEIIENEGAFSLLEIAQIAVKKRSILGGELWELESLDLKRVDADGAL